MNAGQRLDIRELVSDEKHHLSSARVGLWITVLLAIGCFTVDVVLTIQHAAARIPNPVYATLGTMFTVFASWAAGPRIAQYIGPQIGQIASGIGASNRGTDGVSERTDFVSHTWRSGNPDEGRL